MDLARELVPRALAVALSFTRAAGFVVVSPFPGPQVGSTQRVGLALALAWAAGMVAPAGTSIGALDARAVAAVAGELGIGLVVGITFRFVLSAAEALGQYVSQATMLSVPSGFNAVVSSQESALSQAVTLFAVLLALAMGAHRVAISWLLESYRTLPVGTAVHLEAATGTLVDLAADAMAVGLRLSLPAVAVTLATQVALAMISRAAPALQVFSIGISVLVASGITVFVASLRDVALGLAGHFSTLGQRLEQVLTAIAPGGA